ncbi:hypothetical protein AXF42_Ash014651 [Apostasia shenzhenica]|uniref:Secreted protein n=1 Tax=Apostasia shenzhenica TaxID=1088818 RepID=A0A2I0AK93_9ASPA|nr:hypothetical protein AXF42_Ash014651 [Apostasia shenzhenica]
MFLFVLFIIYLFSLCLHARRGRKSKDDERRIDVDCPLGLLEGRRPMKPHWRRHRRSLTNHEWQWPHVSQDEDKWSSLVSVAFFPLALFRRRPILSIPLHLLPLAFSQFQPHLPTTSALPES